MFGKLLRSIGIGSAKVDTIVPDPACVPGGFIQGEVRIYGGNAAQDIETIYLTLMTEYEVEVDDTTIRPNAELCRFPLSDRFTVQANQELAMPFQIPVPLNTPVSMGSSRVWLQTGLDIKGAVDPQDRDYLNVVMHPMVEAFVAAAERIGLRLYKVDVEKKTYHHAHHELPFVQEFEFKASGGEFRGRLDEVEAVFYLSEAGVTVTLQVDRRARDLMSALSESMGLDESYTSFNFTQADLPNLDQILAAAIRRYC